jgi:hypothetical protein
MNEIQPPETFVEWLLGIIAFLWGTVMSILNWNLRRELKRIDKLEEESVMRPEFERIVTQIRDDRVRMHEQNRKDLQYIRERVDTIADRQ